MGNVEPIGEFTEEAFLTDAFHSAAVLFPLHTGLRNFLVAFHLNKPCTALEISSAVFVDARVVFALPTHSQQYCTIICEVY